MYRNALFSAAFADQYSVCLALDPTRTYYRYTYLTDWPTDFLAELALNCYEYSDGDSPMPATPETISQFSFGIEPQGWETLGNSYSKNPGSLVVAVNFSWIFSAKYVIDYWIQRYETATGKGLGGAPSGFRINPIYIWYCMTVNDDERKKGIYTDVLFSRINNHGLGINYSFADPLNCLSAEPLLGVNRFAVFKGDKPNRGGLMEMMNEGFVPIVPIALELDSLRWIQHMDKDTDIPLMSQSSQPSLTGVLNAYDTNGPHGAYWEVITNVLPTQSLKLVLKMSDAVVNPNTHGIAAFAVGVKLNYGSVFEPTHRACVENSYN